MLEEKSQSDYQHRQGSARLAILLFFVMIGLLWAGGQKTCTALANRKPTVMSYSEYVRIKPSASWLTLTNCQLDLPNTCILTHTDDKNVNRDQYYIPVLNPDAPKEKTCVLYKTSDASICAPLKEMNALKTEEALRAWLKDNLNRVFPRRDVSGLVASGSEASDNRSELERLQNDTAENFIILDGNTRPSLAAGIGFTGAGIAMLCGMVVYVRQKRT